MKKPNTTTTPPAPRIVPQDDAALLTVDQTHQLAHGTIKRALQQLIAAGMLGNDPVRLKLENAFEQVRSANEQRKFSIETLVSAADALVPAADFLNNNSKADPAQARAVTAQAGIISKRAVLLLEAARQ